MAHTMKQLETEIKRATKDLQEWQKRMAEDIAEGSPAHVVAYAEKWVKHYEKRLAELEAERPAAIAKEAEKAAKKAAKQEAQKLANGIVIEASYTTYIRGKTPTGKHFYAEANNGITGRAGHCWSLRIAYEVIFTSGTLETVLETVAQN